jgi:hypothetical protein
MHQLDYIWDEQSKQQALWHDWSTMAAPERGALVKELLLGLHEEVAELQRLLDQSRYHILKRNLPPSHASIAEAGVDVFKMLVALMLCHGIHPEQFMEEFKRKTQVVARKWEWEHSTMSGMEVLLCDLDGCVAAWCSAFRCWAKERGIDAAEEHINDPSLEVVKDEFYANGGFRSLHRLPGAVSVLNSWRADPSTRDSRRLIMVTARPYKRHRRVYSDTLEWCHQAGLLQDHILFEPDKAEAVRQVQPAKIVAFIEDRGRHALEVAATGVLVLKLPYEGGNRVERVEHPLIQHMAGWDSIAQTLGVPRPFTGSDKQPKD